MNYGANMYIAGQRYMLNVAEMHTYSALQNLTSPKSDYAWRQRTCFEREIPITCIRDGKAFSLSHESECIRWLLPHVLLLPLLWMTTRWNVLFVYKIFSHPQHKLSKKIHTPTWIPLLSWQTQTKRRLSSCTRRYLQAQKTRFVLL